MNQYAKGGYVAGPREPGDDTVPVIICRGEQHLTVDQARKLTEETRGGEEPFDWRVSPDAIREAEKRDEDQ